MAADVRALIDDLAAETGALDFLIAPLPDEDWSLPTPAEGWSIADTVVHLAYFDDMTSLSMTDPDRFRVEAATMMAGGMDFPDRVAADHRHFSPEQLQDWFARSRSTLLSTYDEVDQAVRLPWYGTEMGVASSITARLMESWAHGQDVADALGVSRVPTERLRHIADLGVRTLGHSFRLRDLAAPAAPVRVELRAPESGSWAWGPADAQDRVAGSAMDFCLVVTQRRHLGDTDLTVTGSTAAQWLPIAQAFAGAPGPGRSPRAPDA